MKICFFISNLLCGGAQRVVSILANRWVAQGNEVVIIYLHDTESAFQFDNKIRLIYLALNSLPKGWYVHRKAVRAFFKKENPDIIISFLEKANIVATSLMKPFNKQLIIISERNNPLTADCIKKNLLKKLLFFRFADKIVTQTENVTTYLTRRYFLSRRKCVVIPNPARKVEIYGTAPKIGPNTIIAMGRLAYQKGFDLLLMAFAHIIKKYPDWRLVIYGEGEERKSLEEQAKMMGIIKYVSFPGIVKDVFGVMKQAEIFVLSSRHEGMPNVLLEAMSSGCACVAYNCDYGPAELIDHEKSGLLVPVGDVNALVKSIQRLIANREERLLFCENAMKKARSFDEDVIFEKWDSLVKTLINTKKSAT